LKKIAKGIFKGFPKKFRNKNPTLLVEFFVFENARKNCKINV